MLVDREVIPLLEIYSTDCQCFTAGFASYPNRNVWIHPLFVCLLLQKWEILDVLGVIFIKTSKSIHKNTVYKANTEVLHFLQA